MTSTAPASNIEIPLGRSPMVNVNLFFTGVLGFMLMGMGFILADPYHEDRFTAIIAFPIFAVIFCGFLYHQIYLTRNKITLSIAADMLAITHGPMTWRLPFFMNKFADKQIPLHSIKNLRLEASSTTISGTGVNGNRPTSYSLSWRAESGARRKMIGGLPSIEAGEEVADWLEQHGLQVDLEDLSTRKKKFHRAMAGNHTRLQSRVEASPGQQGPQSTVAASPGQQAPEVTETPPSPSRQQTGATPAFTLEIPWARSSGWILLVMASMFTFVGLVAYLDKEVPLGITVFLLVGALAVLVASIMHLKNTTWFYTDHGKLYLRHGPVWPFPPKVFSPEDFKQFYVTEVVSSNDGKKSTHYELWAILASGKKMKISAQVSEQEGLEYEMRLEQALGITDQPVKGEMDSH